MKDRIEKFLMGLDEKLLSFNKPKINFYKLEVGIKET